MSDPKFTCHFLDRAQFRAAEDARMALARQRGQGGASLLEIVPPCPMWHAHWIFDPDDPGQQGCRIRMLEAIADGRFDKTYSSLSRHYWYDWSDKRPPLCVMTPNGVEWCIDAWSSNGIGWKVTGTPPKITCHPSIQVSGYHGFLRDGVFTAS